MKEDYIIINKTLLKAKTRLMIIELLEGGLFGAFITGMIILIDMLSHM